MTEHRPRKSGFRRIRASTTRPPDPETLFKDLRKAPGIQYLWSHQADILREYGQGYSNKGDVALELPTGTGKTLIGLLIAEYRRRKFDERALYLCPTRQLAWQVGDHARAYGIEARVLLPCGYEGLNDFHLGNAVGVHLQRDLQHQPPPRGTEDHRPRRRACRGGLHREPLVGEHLALRVGDSVPPFPPFARA